MSLQIRDTSADVNKYVTVDQTFAATTPMQKSTGPQVFQKIKEIVSNNSLWKKILVNVDRQLIHSKEPLDTIMTSCIANVYLLNVLFLGEERAEKVCDFLGSSFSNKFTIDGRKFKCFHLCSGYTLLDLNSKFQNSTVKIDLNNLSFSQQQFPEHHKCLGAFKKYIKEYNDTGQINPAIYGYNDNMIDALESEINGNRDKVSIDRFFVYHVAITGPSNGLSDNTPLVNIKNSLKMNGCPYVHAFDLQHCFDSENNTDCLIIHQAYKPKFTLSEHYERYPNNGRIDAKEFCANLKGLFSPESAKLKDSLFSCFNAVYNAPHPLVIFKPDDGFYTGASIRYVASEINTTDCLKNIEDIVQKYGS